MTHKQLSLTSHRRRVANAVDEGQQVLLSSKTRHVSEISFFHQRTFTWRDQHVSGGVSEQT